MKETFEKLELALKNHDWFYPMSDDSSVYAKGRREADQIKALMDAARKVDSTRADELYSKYKRKLS